MPNGANGGSDTRVTFPLAVLVAAIVGGAWLLFTLWRQDIADVSKALADHESRAGHPSALTSIAEVNAKQIGFEARLDAQQRALIELNRGLADLNNAFAARNNRRDQDWEGLAQYRGDITARVQNIEQEIVGLRNLHPLARVERENTGK